MPRKTMTTVLLEHIELVAVALNVTIFIVHLCTDRSPGKLFYWGGAAVLQVGVYLMQG